MRTFIGALLVAAAAHAQLSPTSETIDVNVIEIDAVVLDANGKPVPGLRPSDFELRVGGRKRNISNFYEVNRRVDEPAAPAVADPPPARRDYLVLFVDDLHLNQREKKRALDALRGFVTAHVRSGTAAMLVRFNGNLEVQGKFTENAEALTRSIDALEQQPAMVSEYERERRSLLNFMDEARRECQDPKDKDCPAETIPQRIQTLADVGQRSVEQTMNALDQTTGLLAGLDGRRMLVYVSDGLPMQPAAEIYAYFKPEEFMRAGNSEIMRVLQQSQPLDAMSHNLAAPLQRLSKQIAFGGVQFFAVDARGVQGFDEGAESAGESSRLDSSLIRANLHGPIQLLADETGGQAIIDENNMELAFAKLDDHLSTYYSLGFLSDSSRREEDVSVSVKRRGVTVHAARHVRQRTTREEIAERVRSGLYARVERNPLDATVTVTPTASGLTATIRVPTAKLSILPGAQSSFAVFTAMLDDKMRETPVRMFVHRIGSLEANESTQVLTLNAPPGTYTVSLAISDSYSLQVSYVQQDVTIRGN